MYAILLSALLSGSAVPPDSAVACEGRVYVDANANGRYDRGERTLRGVAVSDGLNVVTTARDGHYRLPGHAKARFVFISTPGGYVASPFYRHIQAGTSVYDFGVRPYDSGIGRDGAHRFVQISDTEISTAVGQDDWLDDLRAYAANTRAAFIIHTGDICYERGLAAHLPLMNSDNMDRPVYYCIGNHDLIKGERGEAFYEQRYGPVYYSFNAGRVHYVVTPMRSGDYRPGYSMTDVCRWLKNDLAQLPKGTPVVLFNHDYWTEGGHHVLSDGKDERIDLEQHNLKGWLYGHLHINHITRTAGVPAFCTSTLARGGIDHAVSAFRTLHVDAAGTLRSELRYAHVEPQVTVASVHDGHIAPGQAPGLVSVDVNAYATVAPVRDVSFECLLEGRTVVGATPLRQLTDFAWHAETALPEACRGRVATLRVTARFADGQTRIRQARFVYAPDSVPAARPGDDWPTLGGSAAHGGLARDTLRLPLRPAWVRNLGSTVYMASPVVCGDRVVCATTDENAAGGAVVVAVDARTGRTCWRFATRGSVKNSIAATRGLVFAQDARGYLYALDVRTGRLVWEKKLRVALTPGLDSGLTAQGDTVYAGEGPGLCAVDAATGRTLWEGGHWPQREGTTVTLSLDSANAVLVGGVQWAAMYANDARTGRLLWARSEDGIRNRASSPAVHDGLLYFLSQQSLFIVSATSGQTVARRELPFSVDVTSTPAVTDREIIFGTATEGIVALDRQTLDVKWQFRTGEALFYTAPYVAAPAAQVECSPVVSGDAVFVSASDGACYALSRHDGTLLWRHRTGAPILTSAAVSGNMLFVADYAGNLYGFAAGGDPVRP